jgi:GT2 family glycosyltransferase
MSQPLTTIVVVPRERFSGTQRSLESVFEHTTPPFKLVYVDGGSPNHVGRFLETQARAQGFTLIRTPYYLSPNQARNIGLREVDTKYVVFIDNDVVVTPGWLDELVKCAEETGAWAVGPLYCIGEPEAGFIHVAGGVAEIREHDGRRFLHEEHRFTGRKVRDVRPTLRREPVGHAEFHCMLVKMAMFQRLGPFDEGLLSSREHVDFCLTVRQAGGEVYFEPESVVTHVPPPPFAWSDVPYFLTRWSEAWNRASLDHIRKKWNLSDDDPHLIHQAEWLRAHRWIALEPTLSVLRRVLGWRLSSGLQRHCFLPVEDVLTRWLVRRTARQWEKGAPRPVISRSS